MQSAPPPPPPARSSMSTASAAAMSPAASGDAGWELVGIAHACSEPEKPKNPRYPGRRTESATNQSLLTPSRQNERERSISPAKLPRETSRWIEGGGG